MYRFYNVRRPLFDLVVNIGKVNRHDIQVEAGGGEKHSDKYHQKSPARKRLANIAKKVDAGKLNLERIDDYPKQKNDGKDKNPQQEAAQESRKRRDGNQRGAKTVGERLVDVRLKWHIRFQKRRLVANDGIDGLHVPQVFPQPQQGVQRPAGNDPGIVGHFVDLQVGVVPEYGVEQLVQWLKPEAHLPAFGPEIHNIIVFPRFFK